MHSVEIENYKSLIRGKVKTLKRKNREMSLKKLAALIPMQYTFLSKVLNDEQTHLSRTHLYSISTILQLTLEESEYLFLLRDYDATTHPELKKHFARKLEKLKKNKLIQDARFAEGNSTRLTSEVNYLFEPLAVLTHVYLMIESYRKEPRKIAFELGIPLDHLKQIILELANLEIVELEEGTTKVERVLEHRLHYPYTHPLMQNHQKLMRNYCSNEIHKLSPQNKKSFLLSFVSDKETYAKIQDKFDKFIVEANALIKESRNEDVYQLNLDLFMWKK